MNTETQVRCKCKGGLFRTEGSRIEEAFGHRIYECDKCHERWKFTSREYEVQVFDGFSNRKHTITADNYDHAVWLSGIKNQGGSGLTVVQNLSAENVVPDS